MIDPVARPAARAAPPPPWPHQRISVVSVTLIDVAQILAGASGGATELVEPTILKMPAAAAALHWSSPFDLLLRPHGMRSHIAESPPLVRERLHPLPQGTVIRAARRTANRHPAAPKNFNPSALTMEIFQEYFAFAA
jgi:hypothetical protein